MRTRWIAALAVAASLLAAPPHPGLAARRPSGRPRAGGGAGGRRDDLGLRNRPRARGEALAYYRSGTCSGGGQASASPPPPRTDPGT